MIDWLRKRQGCITMIAAVVSAVILLLPFFGIDLPTKEGRAGCIFSVGEVDTTLDSESCSLLPVTNCAGTREVPIIDEGDWQGYTYQEAMRCDVAYTPFSIYFNI